jgi:hypothetical protein
MVLEPNQTYSEGSVMPRLHGYRERLHQPVWDTLVRTTGNPATAIQNNTALFGNANIGQLALTNMQTAGALASDQTFVILALRSYLFFDGTNRRTNYLDVSAGLIWTLTLGTKPMFVAPCWYVPQGGGIWGFDSTTSIFNNGQPGQSDIVKLARPIVVPVRQNFSATAGFFPIGTTDALAQLNSGATDDVKIIQFYLDGMQTRDVQ